MAKKKKMDRIDLKVAAARAEGLSYGQWVAKHPEGLPPGFKPQEPEELEEIETPGPVPATPKKKKQQYPPTRMPDSRRCAVCGQTFKPKACNTKYCCFECARKANAERARNRRRSQKQGAAVKTAPDGTPKERPCTICGKVFKPKAHNGLYCSQECREAAHKAWQKEYTACRKR